MSAIGNHFAIPFNRSWFISGILKKLLEIYDGTEDIFTMSGEPIQIMP
jgi:hypothetical protein